MASLFIICVTCFPLAFCWKWRVSSAIDKTIWASSKLWFPTPQAHWHNPLKLWAVQGTRPLEFLPHHETLSPWEPWACLIISDVKWSAFNPSKIRQWPSLYGQFLTQKIPSGVASPFSGRVLLCIRKKKQKNTVFSITILPGFRKFMKIIIEPGALLLLW